MIQSYFHLLINDGFGVKNNEELKIGNRLSIVQMICTFFPGWKILLSGLISMMGSFPIYRKNISCFNKKKKQLQNIFS